MVKELKLYIGLKSLIAFYLIVLAASLYLAGCSSTPRSMPDIEGTKLEIRIDKISLSKDGAVVHITATNKASWPIRLSKFSVASWLMRTQFDLPEGDAYEFAELQPKVLFGPKSLADDYSLCLDAQRGLQFKISIPAAIESVRDKNHRGGDLLSNNLVHYSTKWNISIASTDMETIKVVGSNSEGLVHISSDP